MLTDINKRKEKSHNHLHRHRKSIQQNSTYIHGLKKKKNLIKVGIKRTYLNIMKVIYNKPKADITINSEKLKDFSLNTGTRQGYPPLSLLFNMVLEILTIAFRQEK